MQLSHSIQMMGTTIDILIDSDTPKEHISEVCRLLTLFIKIALVLMMLTLSSWSSMITLASLLSLFTQIYLI